MQIRQNIGTMVFHMTGASVCLDENECHRLANDIEEQAYDSVYELVQCGDTRSVVCQYAEVASNLLVAAVEEHLPKKVKVEFKLPSPGPASAAKMKLAPLRTRSMTPPPPESYKDQKSSPHRIVHGWLEPGSRVLPYVLLRDEVVVIGRGKEAYESNPKLTLRGVLPSPGKSPGAVPSGRTSRFVEVADGRVSRIHCTVKTQKRDGALGVFDVCIEDCSSNGTYINGNKLGTGKRAVIKDGDRVSLVLSVAPLVEQFFIYHEGDPMMSDLEGAQDWIAQALPKTPDDRRKQRAANLESPASYLKGQIGRTATSRYNTKEWTTLDDLQCQICLSVLRQCVALEPCGHNFCASCLSQHFANLLQAGLPLTCPLRCAVPERVVNNKAVRALIEMHEPLETPLTVSSSRNASAGAGVDVADLNEVASQGQGTPSTRRTKSGGISSPASLAAAKEEAEDEDFVEMSVLCPLYDDMLPMVASSLKSKQVEFSLSQLRRPEGDPNPFMAALESLARLAWSDDVIREEIARGHGIEAMVAAIRRFPDNEGVQCNGCLALMSLVRGEGDVCQHNQWRVAKAGGVETIVEAMNEFHDHAMVQLSALLCMIPLALENPMMQAHVADLALPAVCNAMRLHPKEAEVQAKGMVVLGVLAQGEDAVHDAIRYRQLSINAHREIARSLAIYGGESDEVLWAALFSLAVLVREGGEPFEPACRAAAGTNVQTLVVEALEQYRENMQSAGNVDLADDTILRAGTYLLDVLGPTVVKLREERRRMYAVAATAVAVPAVLYAGYKFLIAR